VQPTQELGLRRVHQLASPLDAEPATTIDLGKGDPAAGPSRPLHARRVADDGRFIRVALPCPGMDYLPRLLTDAPEIQKGHLRLAPGLFPALANRGIERLLSSFHTTLGDRPGSVLPVPPERTARVGEEDLEHIARPSEEQKSRADFGHLVRCSRCTAM